MLTRAQLWIVTVCLAALMVMGAISLANAVWPRALHHRPACLSGALHCGYRGVWDNPFTER